MAYLNYHLLSYIYYISHTSYLLTTVLSYLPLFLMNSGMFLFIFFFLTSQKSTIKILIICKSQRNRMSAMRLSVLDVRDATPMKSHQHGCLNKTQTRMAPTDILTWRWEIPQGFNPTQRTTAT